MIERGYRATTVSAIAERADVHVDTIYQLIGRKPELLRELIEQALSGDDHPIPAAERSYVAAIRGEPTFTGKIAIYAAATGEMLATVAPLYVALRDAAGTDDVAGRLWRRFSDRRAANMREFVGDLVATGSLRTDLPVDVVADSVWVTNSPEVYVMLTSERGWTAEQYEAWLCDAWCRLLRAEPS